jgi:polyphosphate kinase
MKSAGVEINYSVTALKVHAKIALVKRKMMIELFIQAYLPLEILTKQQLDFIQIIF